MKHLKTYKLFENFDRIKADLEDIFLDVKHSHPDEEWIAWADGDDISNYYTVYISFGDEEPYHRDFDPGFDDDEEYVSDYREVQISTELMDCIRRSIEFMKDWKYTILLQDEYSSDPSEDNVEKIELEDLEVGQWMAENQSIKIIFRK
jgi:hypothetical protein